MARFEFEHAARGGIGMHIAAESLFGIYDAAIGALSRLMWEEDAGSDESLDVVWYGFDHGSLVVALINEVLYQKQLNDFRFSRFATERIEEVEELDAKVWKKSAKQLKIFGKLYGRRDSAAEEKLRMSIYAALLPGMRLTQLAGDRYEFYCILDDVGGDFANLPPELK